MQSAFALRRQQLMHRQARQFMPKTQRLSVNLQHPGAHTFVNRGIQFAGLTPRPLRDQRQLGLARQRADPLTQRNGRSGQTLQSRQHGILHGVRHHLATRGQHFCHVKRIAIGLLEQVHRIAAATLRKLLYRLARQGRQTQALNLGAR